MCTDVKLMLLKMRKLVYNLHLPSNMSIVFASFEYLKLSFSIKIPVTIAKIVFISYHSY